MTTPSPLTVADWRVLLGDYNTRHISSDEVREAIEEHRMVISKERLDAGWAGTEPAGEEAITAAEERLGVRLPPSYRTFLQLTDGWQDLGGVDLFPVADIGWFTDIYPDLVEAWSDSESFEEQLAILDRCLLIADDDGGSGCYWLLHADSAGDDGEWTAYVWWPGDGDDPVPYRDFAAMVRQAVRS